MKLSDTGLYGVGIYNVTDASRLTGVPSRTIRRWVGGYKTSPSQGGGKRSALWTPQLAPIGGHLAVGFLDLVEVRVVHSLLERKISWRTIKRAAAHARELFHTDHPFSSARMKTGLGRIFVEIAASTGDQQLIDLAARQSTIKQVVGPFLEDLEFDAATGEALRWWPLGLKRRTVVIDPARSFGRPITAKEGVPTAVLADAVKAEGDPAVVARWYEVDLKSLRDAVAFEQNLAA
jgi:uncharacterized protein (DUF433 family)